MPMHDSICGPSAYAEGQIAFLNGIFATANPYIAVRWTHDTWRDLQASAEQWREGWAFESREQHGVMRERSTAAARHLRNNRR